MIAATREMEMRLGLPAVLLAAMWAVEVANLLTHNALDAFGIHPRSIVGLWGIIFAPFLHGSLAHLIANTIPFAVLGALVALRGRRTFVLVTIFVIVVGGAGVWLVGRPFTDHIGASGAIFGYLGYLLARGVFERSIQAVLFSLVALLLYGGAIWGILPGSERISWESHLFGLIGGVLAARLIGRSAPRTARGGRR